MGEGGEGEGRGKGRWRGRGGRRGEGVGKRGGGEDASGHVHGSVNLHSPLG